MSDRGATLVEYVLMAVAVVIALAVLVIPLINSSQGYYDKRKDTLNYLDKTPLVT